MRYMTDDPDRVRSMNGWIIVGVVLVLIGTVLGVFWGLTFYPA
jgi:hypothetical protein